MKNTFRGWNNVKTLDIDAVTDLIVTGRKACEAKPDNWIYNLIGKPTDSLSILDFGCGFGRNSLGLANYSKNWNVVGYDSENMISRVPEFVKINYDEKMPYNLEFVTDWEQLKTRKFDKILAILVLQHIYEVDLVQYLQDFKKMSNSLMVAGRRFNDDMKKRSTWTILEEQGFIPNKFCSGNRTISYTAIGNPHEHNVAFYTL